MTPINKAGRRAVAGAGAVAIAMALTAVIASGASGRAKAHTRAVRAHAAIDPSLSSAIGAFRQASPLSATDSASLAGLQRIMNASSGDQLPASGADIAAARPSPVGGSSGVAWIAPAGGKVCSFAPLGTEGYGAACSTLAEVKAGEAIRIAAVPSGNTSESVRVVVLVADGQPAPTVIDAEGNATRLSVVENIAAAVLPGTDSIETVSGHVMALSSFTAKLGS